MQLLRNSVFIHSPSPRKYRLRIFRPTMRSFRCQTRNGSKGFANLRLRRPHQFSCHIACAHQVLLGVGQTCIDTVANCTRLETKVTTQDRFASIATRLTRASSGLPFEVPIPDFLLDDVVHGGTGVQTASPPKRGS